MSTNRHLDYTSKIEVFRASLLHLKVFTYAKTSTELFRNDHIFKNPLQILSLFSEVSSKRDLFHLHYSKTRLCPSCALLFVHLRCAYAHNCLWPTLGKLGVDLASPCLMDSRNLRVTQIAYFSLLTYTIQLFLVTICDTIAGKWASFWTKWRTNTRKDRQTRNLK